MTKLYCTHCNEEVVENTVLNKKFFYCRNCRMEVSSPSAWKKPEDIVDIQFLSHFYLDTSGKAHCSFCQAKEGQAHSPRCNRKTGQLRKEPAFDVFHNGTGSLMANPEKCDHKNYYWYLTCDDAFNIKTTCQNCGQEVKSP